MSEEIIPVEIHDTPQAIRDTVRETRLMAQEAAEKMRRWGEKAGAEAQRVYLIGNGTSLYSSIAAAYTARQFAKAGQPQTLPWPSGDFRYYMPALNPGDVVVGISASGEFRDVLAVFEQLEGKCLRVGITHVPGSSIIKVSDALLFSKGGPSRVPVMTKTYASTLAAAHLLMLAFYQAPGEAIDDLLHAADLTEAAVKAADERVPEIVEAWKKYEHAFYFGGGPGYAACLEAALKMKEMALLHAEGNESWEVASGAATLIGPQSFCVALDSGGAGQPGTRDLALQVQQWGAPLLTVGPENFAAEGKAAYHLPARLPAYECFASLVLVPPAALLAYRLARARGYNPDRPSWRERYLAQGMAHILGE